MIKVIQQGRPIEPKPKTNVIWGGTCECCGCKIECGTSDSLQNAFAKHSYYFTKCPTKNCKSYITVNIIREEIIPEECILSKLLKFKLS
jgi:hypothetical protein